MNDRIASEAPDQGTDLVSAGLQWETPRVEVLDVANETEAGGPGVTDSTILS